VPVAIGEEDRLVFRIGQPQPAGDVMSAIAATMQAPTAPAGRSRR
jgi:hypothetical protein